MQSVLFRCHARRQGCLQVKFTRLLESTISVETTLRELNESDQVSDQVGDQVASLLASLGDRTLSAVELMKELSLSHRPSLRKNHLHPALAEGVIEMTLPGKPNSRLQKYRITPKGRAVIAESK